MRDGKKFAENLFIGLAICPILVLQAYVIIKGDTMDTSTGLLFGVMLVVFNLSGITALGINASRRMDEIENEI